MVAADAVPADDPAPDRHHEPGQRRDPPGTTSGRVRRDALLAVLVGGALVAGVVLRFTTRSPLWLDEALSVDIARLPLGDIPEALRHDGHPPLYYVLLHGWMAAFGEGDTAVRAFSGLWALALLPLVWVAALRLGGRRTAVHALALLALSPFAIRYATETRMYAMVSVLALAGWLLVDDALRRPTVARLVGVAAVVAALLWTHYWALWFLAVAAAGLAVRGWQARRAGRSADLRATLAVLGAFVVGGLAFLPWLPSLAYQAAHTRTPWARAMHPTEIVATLLQDLGGGRYAEATVLGWLVAAAAAIGLFGRAVGRFHIDLDLRTRAPGRALAVLVVGTLAVATVAGYATGSTFASRYAAVLVPFVVLLGALGLDQVRSRPLELSVLGVLLVLGGIGGVHNVIDDRTDAARSAAAVEDHGRAGDWVVYCPDQLGPSTSRVLGAGFEQVTYPAFGPPDRVDWVDYRERLDRTTPEAFAAELLERAGDRRIFLVYSVAHSTHEAICPALFNAIGSQRVPEVLTRPTEAPEPASVVLFAPPAG